jgi:polysaccharide biosynthesis protein PslH
MNILFLSRWFPFPPNNGSKIRIYHLLQGLSQLHHVTLLSFSDLPLPSPENLRQSKICSDIQIVPWKPFNGKSVKAQLGFFSSLPRSLVDTHSQQMEALIRNTLRKRKIDVVIASQLSMASYYPSFQGMPALFEEIELGLFYDQMSRGTNILKSLRGRLSWTKLHQYMSHLLGVFTSGTVVSGVEYRVLADNFQKHEHKIEILPNCIDLRDYQNIKVDRRTKHIIFSGAFSYPPNYQAMQWFILHVYPSIVKQVPDVQLIITGDHANLPLPKMDNVILAGHVDDVKSLIASCDVSIAPLWTGGGTRLKIIEAMAIGTPVVATSKGAEGLFVQNGEHILIADEPKKFAEHAIQLLRDRDLRSYISSNAARLVKESYDWQVTMPRFLRLVERTAAG